MSKAYKHEYADGKAGIEHQLFEDITGENNLRFQVWVMEQVTHCLECQRDSVLVDAMCDKNGQGSGAHVIVLRERKRDLILWLPKHEITELFLSLGEQLITFLTEEA